MRADLFRLMADRANRLSGAPAAFVVALASVVGWALTGPVFHFSDTWQLIANTGTTLVTFLMMFLVNGAQNVASELAKQQQDRIEAMEEALDHHVNVVFKEHREAIDENTRLTREIHETITREVGTWTPSDSASN